MPPSDAFESAWYDYPLPDKLETEIQCWDESRRAYWQARLDQEEWSAMKQLLEDADGVADLVRQRAAALQNVGDPSEVNQIHAVYVAALEELKVGFDRLRELVARGGLSERQADELLQSLATPASRMPRQASAMQLVREALWISDANRFVGAIEERVDRQLRLERLVERVAGKDRAPSVTMRYLGLVSRCYVLGLDPECLVMCRAALETALKDTITDDQCRRAGRSKDHPSLDDRIHSAFDPRNGLLSNRPDLGIVHRAAEQVKLQGDKAAHGDPDITKDVLGTIEGMLLVVDALAELPR